MRRLARWARMAVIFEQDVGGSAKERHHVRLWRPDVRGDGGGDRYFTDGEMAVGVLAPPVAGRRTTVLAEPTSTVVRQHYWSWIRSALGN